MQLIFKILLAPLIFALSIAGYTTPVKNPVYGSFNSSGGGTYRLKSSIGTSNSTVPLSSFTEPVSQIPYTMTYLNSDIGYGTIDPQTSKSEFVSFTGITQNADGSATLTGVSRGLSRTVSNVGCVASTTLAQSHSGQSIFILSNSPCFYSEFASRRNDETITGRWNFSTELPYSSLTATTSNQFATKQYADNVIAGGTPTSTETNGGKVELGTALEQANSTDGGANKPLVMQTKNASATWRVSDDFMAVITNVQDYIDPMFIATSSGYNYNWGGLHSFNASTTMNSTTTIAASSAYKLNLNTKNYVFPTSYGTSATSSLTSDTSGNLKWSSGNNKTVIIPSGISIASNTSSTTVFSFTIPAGELGTNNAIHIKTKISALKVTLSNYVQFGLTYGGVDIGSTRTVASAAATPSSGYIDIWLIANNSASSQISSLEVVSSSVNYIAAAPADYIGIQTTSSSAVNSAIDQTLTLTIKFSNSGANDAFTSVFTEAEKIAN